MASAIVNEFPPIFEELEPWPTSILDGNARCQGPNICSRQVRARLIHGWLQHMNYLIEPSILTSVKVNATISTASGSIKRPSIVKGQAGQASQSVCTLSTAASITEQMNHVLGSILYSLFG